jgi:hypothetical protein
VLLILLIAIQVGMFLFWRWARVGYICLTGIAIILVGFSGLMVMRPLEMAVDQLACIVPGAIIAMAYLQPVKSYFDGSA